MPFSGLFKFIGKAFRSTTKRPLQRFNIYNRSKKYIGEESKHFFPAPRAIGPVSQIGASQYPHLEGTGGFKSVKQRRLEAIESRNRRLLELSNQIENEKTQDNVIGPRLGGSKAYSEIKQDDNLVIEASQRLSVIKTITRIGGSNLPDNQPDAAVGQLTGGINQAEADGNTKAVAHRPLPKSTNLDRRDATLIWAVDRVPPGRLDLNKLQELMVNKLADDSYWTPKKIAEEYNIKEEYAANLINYLKQIRIVVSPRFAKILDYTNRNNEMYNATKHVIYIVDRSLRNDIDKSVDETFDPEDELDDSIRELLNAGKPQKRPENLEEAKQLYDIRRPEPLTFRTLNEPQPSTDRTKRSLPEPANVEELCEENPKPPKKKTTASKGRKPKEAAEE